MVFSSITFIYYFLPILLLVYFLSPNRFKNIILLIFSLAFYIYGEPKYIWVLILSCLVNYIFGLIINKNRKKVYLIMAIIFNISLLVYFKYSNFIIQNLNSLELDLPYLNIVMPIGISFFTFQTLGYVVDVYRGMKAEENILTFATYVCLFPQLVAGPIVRYKDVKEELQNRKCSFSLFSEGVQRFVIGLAKKVIIANEIGEMCKILFEISPSILAYILIAIGFTIQIYFDFSGYSDMAIGLGKMFGFNFKENFNFPLCSKSVTEFWRRWHISLSNFFKEYVYIPLGGNRTTKLKNIRNILIVWLLTGLWHGAAWNFIIWGLFFACFLILEKNLYKKFLDKHKIIGCIYTLFLVIISFVIFNADSLEYIFNFFKNLFGFSNLPFTNLETNYYFKSYFILIIIAIIASTPIVKLIKNKMNKKIYNTLTIIITLSLLIIVTAFLIDASFNPFLYFRF